MLSDQLQSKQATPVTETTLTELTVGQSSLFRMSLGRKTALSLLSTHSECQ